ncbi:MAG TPA: polyphenol oxidase family protein [Candidatus Anoxymicrobiaceae bacterium]|jgi:polyphenol oxidase
MLERLERGGLSVVSAPPLQRSAGIVIAFTSRLGGTSRGPFEGLNLSYNVGDLRSSVDANREMVAGAIGVPVTRWVLGMQVHGTAVARVGQADRGRGGTDHAGGVPRTDALVTRTAGIALAVLTADCVPILLVIPDAPAVAAVHAGWRGVLAGIPRVGAQELARCAGGDLGGALAFIGPHIGGCCMVVGDDIASAFESEFGADVVAGRKLDLGAACAYQLERAGIPPGNMYRQGDCTMCSGDYFSHRRDTGCGRQGAFVAILE